MRILIVGGGVGGLALAGFIKDKAEVTVVDTAPKWGDIGFAIALWGNGQKILEKLGILHEVQKESYEIPWNAEADEKGRVLKILDFAMFRKHGPTIVVTRTALHMALVRRAEQGVNVRFNTTIKEISQNKEQVDVVFSDGSRGVFDVVVGADGIHSKVRELVFGPGYLKPYGYTVWSFWTPKGFSYPRGVIELSDSGSIYFVYPLEDKAVIMLATAKKEQGVDNPASKEMLHKVFADFKGSVGHLIDAIEDPAHIFRDKLSYVDIKNWYKGRVVLLGDAQHASSPLTGMGASMALEDAFVLAEELSKVNASDIPFALRGYSRRRGERLKNFHKMSNLIESWIMVKSPLLSKMRDVAIRAVPMSYFTRKIERFLDHEL